MELVMGGAYQGKLSWAKKTYGIAEEEILDCAKGISTSEPQRCLYHMEEFCWWCIRNGMNPIEELQKTEPFWKDAVLICRDVSQGLIPSDVSQRAWREANGRMLTWLAQQAEHVTRIFCGLPLVLK